MAKIHIHNIYCVGLGLKHYRPFHFLMKRTIFACDVSNVADKGNDTAMKSTKTIMMLLMLLMMVVMMRMIFFALENMKGKNAFSDFKFQCNSQDDEE